MWQTRNYLGLEGDSMAASPASLSQVVLLAVVNATDTAPPNATTARIEPDLFSNGLPPFVTLLNLLVVFLSGVLAAAAGVGGGAIYVPLYITLFGLVYEAVPLSKAAVFGVALAFFIENLLEPVPKSTNHPHRFAYDAIMVMEPATLLGTVFGVLASRTCPYWLITLMMTVLLSFSASKTFRKASSLNAKEEAAATEVRKPLNGGSEEPLMPVGGQGYGSLEMNSPDPEALSMAGKPDLPWLGTRCFVGVGVCFLVVLLTAMLVDEDIMKDYTIAHCGSVTWWLFTFANVVVCGAVTIWNVKYLVENVEDLGKQCAVHWNVNSGVRYAVLCLGAGFLSALCGVGGSTIKGPILLEMGIHPTLSKATSQLMLISTVSSSTFQFYLSGAIPTQYGVTFFLFGLTSGYVGKRLIDRYVEANGKQSTIVYLLAWYIVLATVSMTCIGVIIVIGQLTPKIAYDQIWFRSVCANLPPDLAALQWLTTFSFSSKK